MTHAVVPDAAALDQRNSAHEQRNEILRSAVVCRVVVVVPCPSLSRIFYVINTGHYLATERAASLLARLPFLASLFFSIFE